MNFVLLEEFVKERKIILEILELLNTPNYNIFVSYDKRLNIIDFPKDIQKELKKIAVEKCEQRLKDIEEAIKGLK